MLLAVNLIGGLLMIFIIWWFWLYKPLAKQSLSNAMIDIIVDHGVYEPAVITTRVNQPLTLKFIRKTVSPCAAIVIFPELNISAELPVNIPKQLTVTPTKVGEFEFTCQMAMYRGKLIVTD